MYARGGADGLLLVEACRGLHRERAGRFGEVCVCEQQLHTKALKYVYAHGWYTKKENCENRNKRITAGKQRNTRKRSNALSCNPTWSGRTTATNCCSLLYPVVLCVQKAFKGGDLQVSAIHFFFAKRFSRPVHVLGLVFSYSYRVMTLQLEFTVSVGTVQTFRS